MIRPRAPALRLWFSACCPTVAPIVLSLVRMIGAGIAPVLRSRASSFASSVVKLPVMIAFPSGITPFTFGAEISSPPTKIATGLLRFFSVISLKRSAPSSLNWISTYERSC